MRKQFRHSENDLLEERRQGGEKLMKLARSLNEVT